MVRSTALALLALTTPAFADAAGDHPVDRAIDSAIVVGAVAAALAPMALPVREHPRWQLQLLGTLDEAAYDQFSERGAQLSDVVLALAVAAPAAYLTGSTIDDADGDYLVLYAETLAIDLAIAQIAKYVVHRPRPYLYSHRPEVAEFAQAAGDDAWRSFYSSHAALSFGAAAAGAYLLSESTANPTARAFAWAAGFAAAAATSNLRVRAGRHFYSDVIVGGLIGAAVGYAVPALHARGRPYAPTRSDLAMAGVGLFGGTVISELIPLAAPAPAPAARPGAVTVDRVQLAPLALRDGAGLAISGRVQSQIWERLRRSRPAPARGDE